LTGTNALFSASSTVFGRGFLQQEGKSKDSPPATKERAAQNPKGMKGAMRSDKIRRFGAAMCPIIVQE